MGTSSVDEVRSQAIWAQEHGFDSFWLAQLFGLDACVTLAAVGAAAPGLREMGTSIVPLYGRHPLVMAAMASTAQSAIGGRFTLGLGPSHRTFVEAAFG